MPPHLDEHTGARIARARKVRRLTRRELSDLAHVSYSTLTKAEQGALPASPSVIGALARARPDDYCVTQERSRAAVARRVSSFSRTPVTSVAMPPVGGLTGSPDSRM